MITSTVGYAVVKFRHPCVTFPFAMCNLLFGLILTIFGGVVASFAGPIDLKVYRGFACDGFPEIA